MDNRTMLPLRFVSEYFGAVVNWDGEAQRIEIIGISGANASSSTNANHNPNTGRDGITTLAREDEDEEEKAIA